VSDVRCVEAAGSVADLQCRGRVVWLAMFGRSLSGKTPWIPGRVFFVSQVPQRDKQQWKRCARFGFCVWYNNSDRPEGRTGIIKICFTVLYCSV